MMSTSASATTIHAAMSARVTGAGSAAFMGYRDAVKSGGLLDRSGFEHLLHALNALFEHGHAGGERRTEMTRCTETRTWNHRNARVVDEHFGERVIVPDTKRRHR